MFIHMIDLYEGKILRKFRLGSFLDMKLAVNDRLVILSGDLDIYDTKTGTQCASISYMDDLYLEGNKVLMVSDSGERAVFTNSVDQILVICDLKNESCREINGSGRFVEFCSRDGNVVIAIGRGEVAICTEPNPLVDIL